MTSVEKVADVKTMTTAPIMTTTTDNKKVLEANILLTISGIKI